MLLQSWAVSRLLPAPEVDHDAVSVGGKLDIAEEAVVHGHRVNVARLSAGQLRNGSGTGFGIASWNCVRWPRRSVGFWVVAALFFVVYLWWQPCFQYRSRSVETTHPASGHNVLPGIC